MNKMLKDGRLVTLKEMDTSHASQIINYLKQVFSESKNMLRDPEEFTLSVEEEREYLDKIKHSKVNFMVGCFYQNELIGLAGFNGRDLNRIRHVVSIGMSVLHEYQHLGVGSLLMQQLIAAARNYKIKRIELEVREDNIKAINLYKKFGFEVEGIKRSAFNVGNHYYNLLVMGLLL